MNGTNYNLVSISSRYFGAIQAFINISRISIDVNGYMNFKPDFSHLPVTKMQPNPIGMVTNITSDLESTSAVFWALWWQSGSKGPDIFMAIHENDKREEKIQQPAEKITTNAIEWDSKSFFLYHIHVRKLALLHWDDLSNGELMEKYLSTAMTVTEVTCTEEANTWMNPWNPQRTSDEDI